MEPFDLDAVRPAQPFVVTIGGEERKIEFTPDSILRASEVMAGAAPAPELGKGKVKLSGDDMDRILAILTLEADKPKKDQFFMSLDARRRLKLAEKLIGWYNDTLRDEGKKKECSPESSDSTDSPPENSEG